MVNVADVVHYVESDSVGANKACRAAIVTFVLDNGQVHLAIFKPLETDYRGFVSHDGYTPDLVGTRAFSWHEEKNH